MSRFSSRLRSWWQQCEWLLLTVVVGVIVAVIGSWRCTAFRESAYRQGFEAGLLAVVEAPQLQRQTFCNVAGRGAVCWVLSDGRLVWLEGVTQ